MKQKNRKSLLKATLAISTLVLTGCFGSSGSEEVYYYDDYSAYENVPQDQIIVANGVDEDIFIDDVFVDEVSCPATTTTYTPKKKTKTVSMSAPAEPDVVPVKPRCGQICSKTTKTTAESSNKSLEKTTQKAVVKEKPQAPAPTPVAVVPNKPIVVEYVSETVEVKQTTQAAKETEKAAAAENQAVVVETQTIGNPVPVIGESEDYVQENTQPETEIVTFTEKNTQTERQEAVEQIRQRVEEEQAEVDRLKAQAEQLNEQRKALEEQTQAKAQTMQQSQQCEACEDVKDWVASEGSTLRTLLMEWGNQVGWRVVWNMDRDYTLEAGAVFRGRFVEVAAALLRSFARATPAPKGVFYKGNKVLVVSTREDENAD